MGLREDAHGHRPIVSGEKVKAKRSTAISVTQKKKQKQNNNKNLKQIFILSFDALRERKARSALTILMVIVGGGLMIAINAMSAGQSAFVNRQLNTLAPNIMFVSSGQHGFRGPSGPPTIIFNSEVVNRIKSLPYVQQVIPVYSGSASA